MWKLLSLLVLCSFIQIYGVDLDCGGGRECRVQDECPAFLELKNKLKFLTRNSDEYERKLSQIKSLVCNKNQKKVCCVREQLETSTSDYEILGEDLICRGGRECRVVEECPLFELEKNQLKFLSKSSDEYQEKLIEIKSLVCNKKLKKVCCLRTFLEDPADSPSWVPSFRKQECGLSAEGSQFVLGGSNTNLGEFPWSVLLGKKSEYGGRVYWHCGGTLINKWYVLTAAHCGPKVDKVRVGEWKVVDTSKPDPDTCTAYSENQRERCENTCTIYSDNRGRCQEHCGSCNLDSGDVDCICDTRICRGGVKNICAEKHQDIEVAEVKIHESYRTLRSRIAINDIMLVKLKYPVNINKFASPICLPDEQEKKRIHQYGEKGTEQLLSGGKPIVVGWGKTYTEADTDIYIVQTARQQQLAVPVVSNQQCADKYSELFKRDVSADIQIEQHICAGGEVGKDSCRGDSGGPLVGRNGVNPYILVGVVSAGTKDCGIGAPGIYTRVTHYREWIMKNL